MPRKRTGLVILEIVIKGSDLTQIRQLKLALTQLNMTLTALKEGINSPLIAVEYLICPLKMWPIALFCCQLPQLIVKILTFGRWKFLVTELERNSPYG